LEGVSPVFNRGIFAFERADMTASEYKMILQGRRQRFHERYAWTQNIVVACQISPGLWTPWCQHRNDCDDVQSWFRWQRVDRPIDGDRTRCDILGNCSRQSSFASVGDHAQRANADDAKVRLMISSGLVMIYQGARPHVVFEHMLGFVPVTERDDPRF